MNDAYMRQLADGAYIPLTFGIGFLEQSLEATLAAYVNWMKPIRSSVTVESLNGPVVDSLLRLAPLTTPPIRLLLVETQSNWTAYFSNDANATDSMSFCSHLARVQS